jgi:hypothetical protein
MAYALTFSDAPPVCPHWSFYPGPCRPTSMITVGGLEERAKGAFFSPINLDQFVMNNLDDLLARMNAGKDFLAEGGVLHIGNEFLDNLYINIRFKQGRANLLQRIVHIRFGQATLTANGLENGFKAFCQAFKHKYKQPV